MNTGDPETVLYRAERRVLKIQTKLYQGSGRPTWGLWRARCGESVRRFTRRWIAPSGGRGSGGGDLGATRLTWTRKREGTTAWRESVEYRGGVEGAAAQGPRDMAKARLLEAQSPAVQTSHPVTRRL